VKQIQTDRLIERLTHDLKPVRPRKAWRDAVSLFVLGIAELGLFLAFGLMRPDMPMAIHLPSFWWKLVSLGLIALVSGAVAILSLDPIRSPRGGLRWVLVLIVLSLAAGWAIDASHGDSSALLTRLHWRDGLLCLCKIAALSVPAVAALGLLMRRGAPTDRGGTALAAGFAAATWGALVFVFACPFDDPFYVFVWYSLACVTVTLFARIALPRLTRW
jgi:hypothetical protein